MKHSNGRWGGWGWMHVPEWDMTIAAPPKAGSTTLKDFVWQNNIECDYIPFNRVNRNKDVFFVVRDPISRFKSLWRDKCAVRHRTGKRYIQWALLEGCLPEELMTAIENGQRDVHITPQTEILGDMQATLIPLHKLNTWWSDRGYGDLESANTNKTVDDGTEFNDALIQRVETFYATDVELYKTIVL